MRKSNPNSQVPDFTFIGFDPDQDTVKKAYAILDRLMNHAPYGSMAVALLQKESQIFRCAIEIYSLHGPFTAQAFNPSPEEALKTVAFALSEKLQKWKLSRRLDPLDRDEVHLSSRCHNV